MPTLAQLSALTAENHRDESPCGLPAFLWLLAALLAAGLLWVNSSPAKVSPDEHFYTDAAIQMCRTGDYWTPTYPDGSIRLLKPILTYWALVGSFKVFGISLSASRAASALAGVLVVLLTCQLARAVTNWWRTSLLAAAIIAANMKVLVTATWAGYLRLPVHAREYVGLCPGSLSTG